MDDNSIIKELAEISERSKSNTHRIDELNVKVDKLTEQNTAIIELGTSVKLLNKELIHMREDTDKNFATVKEDVGELSDTVKQVQKDINEVKIEPSKQKAETLDKVRWLIVSGAISGILGFVIGMILK